MRDYEVVYIFRPSLESEEVEEKLESFHQRLDGETTAVEHWGKRRLAFEIEGERSGYYVVAQFRAEPAGIPEFEQALQMDEELIRHLVVLSEGELPVPPSQRGDEDEDEEETPDEEEGDEEEEDEADDEEASDEAPADDEDEDEDEADEESSDEEEEK